MPNLVFDTRFLAEYFYSSDSEFIEKAKSFVSKNKDRYVSTLTIHETYLLSLRKEGRETARMRLQVLLDTFRTLDVNAEIAVAAAELRHGHKIPMADGVIAATCKSLQAKCVTDDPHFQELKEIKTVWP
ncbi:MAG: PIN domain-containing protein [Candidatus Bathyarchaeia archaeon]|jgi:predicted nucleic acid-binding protein